MNRRGVMGLLAGAPLFGKAVAEHAVESLGTAVPPSHPFTGNMGAQAMVNPPLMERDNALKTIFGDAGALADIRAELFAEQRTQIPSIDPDLMVLRSLSPMAKITFQRQRNVDRAIADLQDNAPWDRPQRYIRAFNDRLNKLMWGK